MKILKYILLLLLLVFIASSVFVATLNPNYNIVRIKVINAPKSVVFSYVNDFKNWEEFGEWKQENPSVNFKYSKNTTGKGSFYSWIAKDGEGSMKTIFVKENDSIAQKMNFNGSESIVSWRFVTEKGKTKVIWRNEGKMDFLTKIFTAIFGGMDSLIGGMYEKKLDNIDKNLKSQISTFSIKVDGFLEKNMGLYLQKSINSKNQNIDKNIQIMIPDLLKYLKDNKISFTGKPFVKYNRVNDSLQITNISVAVTIKDSLELEPNSGLELKTLLPFQAIKTTLNGDLIHKQDAINQALELMDKNYLIRKIEKPLIEIYKVNKTDFKNPSKWVTEIYIPVKPKTTFKK